MDGNFTPLTEIRVQCQSNCQRNAGHSLPTACVPPMRWISYGNDRPDIRFGLDISGCHVGVRQTPGFQAFSRMCWRRCGQIKLHRAARLRRLHPARNRRTDRIGQARRRRGLATVALTADGVKSPIAKFLNESEIAAVTTGAGATPGDLVVIVADQAAVVAENARYDPVEMREPAWAGRSQCAGLLLGSRLSATRMGRREQSVGFAAQPILWLHEEDRTQTGYRSRTYPFKAI